MIKIEVGERISELRKNLNLSQEDFGKKINVTRSAVSNYEKGLRNIMDRVIFDICREFNVNEDWLRNGTGKMFVEEDTFSLDGFAKSKGATDFDIALIKYYFEFPKDLRDALKKHFETNILPDLKSKNEITATEETVASSIEYEVESYRAELVAEQKGETYLVSENSEEKNLA
ncbi:hypothetical protein SDC9_56746 [bioreactor metagenome]|uniref:HTH cro/C1-type domain-containing protein n=1 Tax=bioreactor metagenome TaxID=1076179 RepID=A0A644X8E5_9ZZZZ